MNKKWNTLFEKYPATFGGLREEWGFECDEGYFQILNDFGERVENICSKYNLGANQVKEKYGVLEIYLSSTKEMTETEQKLIDTSRELAKIESFNICEICGESGRCRMTPNGRYKTICDDCLANL